MATWNAVQKTAYGTAFVRRYIELASPRALPLAERDAENRIVFWINVLEYNLDHHNWLVLQTVFAGDTWLKLEQRALLPSQTTQYVQPVFIGESLAPEAIGVYLARSVHEFFEPYLKQPASLNWSEVGF